MKVLYKRAILFTLSCVCALLTNAQTIELSEGWKCRSSAAEKWYDTKVPTTVMGVLVNNGEYPNLLEGDHYKKLDNSRFLVPWLFKKDFRLDGLNADEQCQYLPE